jgi:hypothetical protein
MDPVIFYEKDNRSWEFLSGYELFTKNPFTASLRRKFSFLQTEESRGFRGGLPNFVIYSSKRWQTTADSKY